MPDGLDSTFKYSSVGCSTSYIPQIRSEIIDSLHTVKRINCINCINCINRINRIMPHLQR